MNRTENETGVAEIIGAIILISVIVLAIGVVGVGLLSRPLPEKIPAVSVDITIINNTVYIRHEGGDSLPKGEFNITLDGVDVTDSFKLLDNPASWSTWALGETLYYIVPAGNTLPTSVQIGYHSGSSLTSLGIYTPRIVTLPYAKRVKCASVAPYTDTNGNVWSTDQSYTGDWGWYTGGHTYSTPHSVSGTSDPALYQSNRYSDSGVGYKFNVPNGNYQVTLKFAETYWDAADQRVFNITIHGTQVESSLDVFNLVGHDTAMERTYAATVNDNVLNIDFLNLNPSDADLHAPMISAIQITSCDVLNSLNSCA